MQWKEDTKGLDRILDNLAKLSAKEVQVGFFDKKYGDDNNNLYVAQVAQWNEEGHMTGGGGYSPPRPFFRSHLFSSVKSSRYTTPLGKMIYKVMEKEQTVNSSLKKFGEGLALELAQIIDEGDFAPNAPEWSAHKLKVTGSSTPLTYTGVMKDSVEYRIVNKNSGG